VEQMGRLAGSTDGHVPTAVGVLRVMASCLAPAPLPPDTNPSRLAPHNHLWIGALAVCLREWEEHRSS
jgi:hypothetical protein